MQTWKRSSIGLGGALATAAALVACQAGAPLASASSQGSASTPKTLTVYSQGDVNVQALWQKTLVPGYEKSHPGTKIKLVFTTDGSENTDVYDEIAASVKAHRSSSFDIVDGSVPAEAAPARLLTKVDASEIPAIKDITSTDFKAVDNEAVPLRGSEVLLAYNSTVVSKPPKTLGQLISWIRANPGKFTYCNPSDGGSGSGFVEDVLSSFDSSAESLKLQLGYEPGAESSAWSKGLSLLKSIGSDIFQQQYPDSNTGVLTLLASGAVDMAPVWSDEATAALQDGQLPKSIKLVELAPPMEGGPDYLGVPKNIPQAYKTLAFNFIDWALQPKQQEAIIKVMSGTPAIEFKYLPAAVAKEFEGYSNTPELPYSAKTGSDMNSQWTSQVG